MSQIEIRIVNLYIERGKTFQKVKVEAGYENSMSLAFEGEITNIYDEAPGPEKVTVITCTQGKLLNMIGSTIAINLNEGFSLKEALIQITKAAGLDDPIISLTEQITSNAPFTFNGTVQEALHQLGPMFPAVILIFTDKTIKAVTDTIAATESPKTIKFLQSPPQVVGSTVIIKAPWDPSIKPGDVVTVDKVNFITKGSIAVGVLLNKYRVTSVEFRYSTITGANSMTLQGFYPEAAA
jgi:hypothetical protein